jgi:SHS family lactate transporter-like MFS transporter
MLFACRALFGIGMGGVWSAGMPLALEHWPAHLRGRASGLLQSAYATGYILMAVVYQFVHPLVADSGELAWRFFFWLGIIPSLLAFWIMRGVKESPVWLESQRQKGTQPGQPGFAVTRLFKRELLPVTIHGFLLMAGMLSMYYSITYLYPKFLQTHGLDTLGFVVSFNLGGILGGIGCGRLAETWLGRRGASGLVTVIGVASLPLYLFASNTGLLMCGAFLVGVGTGNFGMTPTYLSERFPTSVRAAGAGFAYQAGGGLAAITPTLIGMLEDGGMPLASAMAWCTAVSGLLVIVMLALGPETRGRELG